MGKFDSIPYKSLSGEPNTFGRPRQKMWGVFIINSFSVSNGELVPLNFGKEGFKQETKYIAVGGEKLNSAGYVDFSTVNVDFKPPEFGPKGETIMKQNGWLKHTAVSTGSTLVPGEGYYPGYNKSDWVLDNLYFYYKQVKTTKWSLVKLTSNIQEAKNLVNDWLRMPEINTTTRPLAGIASIMITEIVPADSVIEL